MTGPVLCFGGPYSNLQAITQLKTEADAMGFDPSCIICTGDVVAYCAHPLETVRFIQNWGVHVIKGNCEQSLGFGADDCGCGFDEGSQCDVLSNQWYRFAATQLDGDAKRWMRSLPDVLTLKLAGQRMAVIHGGVNDISAWVFKSTAKAIKQNIVNELGPGKEPTGIIAGHCGLPFTDIDVSEKCLFWHNPGVIGMPANDGTPRVWYSVIDSLSGGGLDFRHHALNYDFQAAASAMADSGLSAAYRHALTDGYWPNMDVLPGPEQQRRGKAIAAGAERFMV